MITLTLERTKELLAEAVVERGEGYVYTRPDGKQSSPDGSESCFYVHTPDMDASITESVPGCIAGYVLHKAGVPLEALRTCETAPADSAVSHLSMETALSVDSGVAILLREVQVMQDRGRSWGEAVRETLARL
jgi:hypothetical protein